MTREVYRLRNRLQGALRVSDEHTCVQEERLASATTVLRLRGVPRHSRARVDTRPYPNTSGKSLYEPFLRRGGRNETGGSGAVLVCVLSPHFLNLFNLISK